MMLHFELDERTVVHCIPHDVMTVIHFVPKLLHWQAVAPLEVAIQALYMSGISAVWRWKASPRVMLCERRHTLPLVPTTLNR